MTARGTVVGLSVLCSCLALGCAAAPDVDEIELSPAHVEAVNRPRRVIFQHDLGELFIPPGMGPDSPNKVADFFMSAIDEESSQIDSVWHDYGAGDRVPYPSELLPPMTSTFPQWWEAGRDPVRILLEAVKQRGREVFFAYRANVHYPLTPGAEHGWAMPAVAPKHPDLVKANRPDWVTMHAGQPFWNYAIPEVRDLKVRILRELAENYDFDGISVDFARTPRLLPIGRQWKDRDDLTAFMRQLRLTLLEVERQRGRPFLLAARVPETVMGCHFDGMDVERWARERLVDIFVLGSRSSDVKIEKFRSITAGTGIKLYPGWTDHHASDGYGNAPIEVLRGVFANWWSQRPDGVYAFNFFPSSPGAAEKVGRGPSARWNLDRQMFAEIGSPETLRDKDKVFYVQRRGGGHGAEWVPSPDNWHTPRHAYFLTNMFAPLPAPLTNDGRTDTLLTLKVADDVSAASGRIETLTLRLLLAKLEPQKLTASLVEVRINNLLLTGAIVDGEWLVFPVDPLSLAVGDNLVGVRVTERPPGVRREVTVEKLELHVKYR